MRRVVVTGGGSGIGRAAAREMATLCGAVLLVGRRQEALAQAAKELPGRVETLAADVADPESGRRIAEAAEALGEGELCLVNAAGTGSFGPIDTLGAADIEGMVHANLLGTILTCRALLPALRATHGQVVNVASIAGLRALSGASVYGACKAAVLAFTRGLAEEERRNGVRVCAISPGATATEFWEAIPGHPPLERMLPPAAVGQAIRDILTAPRDRAFDEVVLMPPDGIL